MRYMIFAGRNRKEILRDPLSVGLGLGFPIVIMVLLSTLQKSIEGMPVELFGIDTLAPGMIVFGFSFLSMFLGMLMANDRESSFLLRLLSTPLSVYDFLIGYSLPIFKIAIMQCMISFSTAALLGMKFDGNIFILIAVVIPVSGLFISIGVLMGTILNNKQVSAFGTILVNAVVWFGGAWFSLDMIKGGLKVVSTVLPFSHAVDVMKFAMSGEYSEIWIPLLFTMGYTVAIYLIACIIFKRKMKG